MAPQAAPHRTRRIARFRHDSHPSVFTCPDCQGTLFVVRQENVIRFRCRVGHSYSPESMLESQDENVERLMWSAARALEEQAEYISQMVEQLSDREDSTMARNYFRKALSAIQKSDAIRKLITASGKSLRR
jgi:two-component system chemotaxis response regulator CheB